MGAGTSTGISAALNAANNDEVKKVLLGVPRAERQKLEAALNACKGSRQISDYRSEPGPNILRMGNPEEYTLAQRVLKEELCSGNVEFFCGSGVGRDLTGTDWIGLVNIGASAALKAALEVNLEEDPSLKFVRTCHEAFAEAGSPTRRKAVLDQFQGDFFAMVKAYAQAVDVCLSVASLAGSSGPKTYNTFIADFMTGCHAKDTCPGQLARSIASCILKQLNLGLPRDYSVYTTNYSRSVNLALLEKGVIVREIYPVRYNWETSPRNSADYGGDVHLACSVVMPANGTAESKLVTVFHLHGIAKSREEFEEPHAPGPLGRSRQLWTSQQHFVLGKAKDLFSAEDPRSFLKPWGSASHRHAYHELVLGQEVDASERKGLFEAAAEGIVISDAHYDCKMHSEALKGNYDLATDDCGRTLVIMGSSLTDEFFERFLNDGLDENIVHFDSGHPDESTPANQGITIQTCIRPQKKFLEGEDVQAELKPYLLFVCFVDSEGRPHYQGFNEYIESAAAC